VISRLVVVDLGQKLFGGVCKDRFDWKVKHSRKGSDKN